MVVLSLAHQANCLVRPLPTCFIGSAIFTGIDYARGARGALPARFGRLFALIYVYNALQCPMEAISERRSLLHNISSAGIIGYVGVRHGLVGVPFVPFTFFIRYPQVPRPIAGAVVFGSLAGVLAGAFGGKPI